MPLIWRGFGIVVPIVFFVTGWIVSFWFGDGETTLGNASYIGWTAMYSGIVLLLIGLGALAAGGGEEGQPKKKHDFFYVPIFVWGLLLGALSIYLLVFTAKAAPVEADVPEEEVETELVVPTTRTINLFNTSDDSLSYIIADDTEDGLIAKGKVGPNRIVPKKLAKGTYLFASFDADNKTVLKMPLNKEIAADENKYTKHTDEKGSFYQRNFYSATKENDDYDAAWLMLDGKTDMIVVAVSSICNADATEESVKATDWESQIFDTYDGSDLIEPMYKKFMEGFNIKMVEPGDKIPSEKAENEAYYLLLKYDGSKSKAETITNAIINARFKY